MLLSPNDVQEIGLDIMKVHHSKRKSHERMLLEFHKHFGSSLLDIAEMWYDLCYYDESLLPEKEKTEKGFKHFLAAHYWLWVQTQEFCNLCISLWHVCGLCTRKTSLDMD
jgi:hypothetical protein